jgi:hypothetical protein
MSKRAFSNPFACNVETMVGVYQRNMEACAAANQAALETMRSVAAFQADMVRHGVNTSAALLRYWRNGKGIMV